MGRWDLGIEAKEFEDQMNMQQKFGLQVNSKAEADLIASALEAYVSANPQSRTVVFSDIMRRLGILQNNLGKIESLESRAALMRKQQEEMNKNRPQRGNPLPPVPQKPNIKQSAQVQQRNQRINLPKR